MIHQTWPSDSNKLLKEQTQSGKRLQDSYNILSLELLNPAGFNRLGAGTCESQCRLARAPEGVRVVHHDRLRLVEGGNGGEQRAPEGWDGVFLGAEDAC